MDADATPRTTEEPATLLLSEVIDGFVRQRAMAERALAQLSDDAWHQATGDEDNSVAVLVRHLTGNLHSRWSGDPFTSDGEKPSRDRDGEFAPTDRSPEALKAEWAAAWAVAEATLAGFGTADLDRTVVIRGVPHTLAQALVRSLTHTAGHVGQIVLLAKHLVGSDWATLSIPKKRATG
ncbi:MAG: DUF1572 family protein [Trueperaceae bacterium]